MKFPIALTVLSISLLSSVSHAATYFFHNDHLGTPQVLTDENQQPVWDSAQEPFGEATQKTNEVKQNLRFSGQYFDVETGLHYNYHRDYDSSTGRYLQSDPIGVMRDYSNPRLQAAVGMGVTATEQEHYSLNSLFGYANQNPVSFIDPTGLDSLRAKLMVAIGRGNTRQLKNLLDALGDPKLKKAAQDAIDKFSSKAEDWISKNCKGSINKKFPDEMRDKTLEEIRNGKTQAHKTAWKLLNDSRFKK